MGIVAGRGRSVASREDAKKRDRSPRPSLINPTPDSLAKQIVQRRLRTQKFASVLCDIGSSLRLEVIAEICLIFFPHLLRRRLLAMLGIAHVVLDTHLANVQLSVARLTNVEPPQRQTQRRQRCSATPTD